MRHIASFSISLIFLATAFPFIVVGFVSGLLATAFAIGFAATYRGRPILVRRYKETMEVDL